MTLSKTMKSQNTWMDHSPDFASAKAQLNRSKPMKGPSGGSVEPTLEEAVATLHRPQSRFLPTAIVPLRSGSSEHSVEFLDASGSDFASMSSEHSSLHLGRGKDQ